MGVCDYECRYCGEPQGYDCAEAAGGACQVSGIGNDEAMLELFFFKREGAPSSLEDFRRRRGEAVRRERRTFNYDWGDWEFVPSLNYRAVLMDDTDNTSRSTWRVDISAQTEDGGVEWDEHSAIAIPYEKDEVIWVVNACPACARVFDEEKDTEPAPCRLLLEQVARHTDLTLPDGLDTAGKLAFLRGRFAEE